uniref:Heme-binding protein 1 n=1 Tax=Hippocampus comes TaxID=109280 RepID=A0A3Q2XIR6_HIPCM
MFGMIKNSLFGNSEETEYKLLSTETKGTSERCIVMPVVRVGTLCDYVGIFFFLGKVPYKMYNNNGIQITMFPVYLSLFLFQQGEAMGTAAPTIITVYPRNDGVLSRRLVVAIRIPTVYQQSPPTPTDSTIRVEERPGMTVYTLQFGGFAGESEYRAEALRLTRTLGETAPFQRKQYFCCSYDSPIKPYGRRNEVWFIQEEP